MKKLNYILLMVLAISLAPICVRSEPPTSQSLKEPIFGNLIFAVQSTTEAIAGATYSNPKYPYVYINTGKSVKCFEVTSGKLAHTVVFDPSTDTPYDATDDGIVFAVKQNDLYHTKLIAYDGTVIETPVIETRYWDIWKGKECTIINFDDKDNTHYFAKNINGKLIWELFDVNELYSLSSARNILWVHKNDSVFLLDPFTGKTIYTEPKDYYMSNVVGSFLFLMGKQKTEARGIVNLETGKIIHECKDCFHVIGKDGFLCYKKASLEIHDRCYDFERYSKDGELLESFSLKMPDEYKDNFSFIGDYYENHISVMMREKDNMKVVLTNTKTNKRETEIAKVIYHLFSENDKLFYYSNKKVGCFDIQTMNQIWEMPVGNNDKFDYVYEKDFNDFTLMGREILGANGHDTFSLQVKIVDKADGFVEPYEFEFEYGNLDYCYETDYGLVNINDLSKFSIYTPQISFYRRGSVKAVGKIDYIGDINPDTISIKDDRFLTGKLRNKTSVEIDTREMSFKILED